jgi:hypothetical protein
MGGTLAGPEGTPYKATLTFGNVTLPRGIACGGPLPVTLGPSHLVIKIMEGHVLKFKISGRRRASGALDGILLEDISTSLCNGRFLFRATLEGSFGVRVFSYPFLLSRVTGVAKGCH